MATQRLTEVAIKKARFGDGPKKRSDGQGLFLLLKESGATYWRFAYDFAGSEKLLSLGVCPEVSLKEAREKHQGARKLLAQGVDPSAARKASRHAGSALAADSFETVAREFLEVKQSSGRSGAYLMRQDGGRRCTASANRAAKFFATVWQPDAANATRPLIFAARYGRYW